MFRRTTSVNKIGAMKGRYRVVQGGTSAGKTFSIMSILINIAATKPKKRIDVISMTYDHLSSGAIADFKNIMQNTNRWNDSRWNETNHIYTFANSSFIRFKSLDKPMKARGPRRDILYVNEANTMPFGTYTELETRTNDFIFIDFNPTNRFWAHDDILRRPDSEFLLLTYKDNEAIPPTLLDTFQWRREQAEAGNAYWKNWCRVMLDGEVGRLEGAIFENWTDIDNVPEGADFIAYGLDFGLGGDDPTTLIGVYKWQGKIILDEKVYKSKLLTKDLAGIIKGFYKNEEVYADHMPSYITELNSYGIRTYSAKKGPDSVNLGISLMQQYDLLITRNSINLIREFENYKWSENQEGIYTNKPIDKFNHGIDAVRYVFRSKLDRSGNNDKKIRVSRF